MSDLGLLFIVVLVAIVQFVAWYWWGYRVERRLEKLEKLTDPVLQAWMKIIDCTLTGMRKE